MSGIHYFTELQQRLGVGHKDDPSTLSDETLLTLGRAVAKLQPYMVAVFLSVSVVEPAFSDVDCDFIKKEVSDEMKFLQTLDATLERKLKKKTYDDAYYSAGKMKEEIQQSLNSYANIYAAFCK